MTLPAVGARARLSRTFSDGDIETFVRLSGDDSPIHVDEEYAARSRFGRRIVHGLLAVSQLSAVLGTLLPGPGTIYLSQSFQFKAPVFIGDTITSEVIVEEVRADKPIVTLRTILTNQDGKIVIEGQAVVLAP